MGSAKKKKAKKQDFLKPKLKVGKTKAKAANFTDTSFKSKVITMSKQSLLKRDVELEPAQLYSQNLSLTAAKSDTQRRDALASLTSQLSSTPFKPSCLKSLLDKVLPLISDSSAAVRTNQLKLLRVLPAEQMRNRWNTEQTVLSIRGGMTHLSKDVNSHALSVLEWLLEIAPKEIVEADGGWSKLLRTFCAMLGWNITADSSWTSAPAAELSPQSRHTYSRQIKVLTKVVRAGLTKPVPPPRNPNAYWDSFLRIPRNPRPYAHLHHIFAIVRGARGEDADNNMDRQSRQHVLKTRFMDPIFSTRLERLKREGGAIGRAVAALEETIKEGMEDYTPVPDFGSILDEYY